MCSELKAYALPPLDGNNKGCQMNKHYEQGKEGLVFFFLKKNGLSELKWATSAQTVWSFFSQV